MVTDDQTTPLRGNTEGDGWHFGLARETWRSARSLYVAGGLLAGGAVAWGRGNVATAVVLASLGGGGLLLLAHGRVRRGAPRDHEGREGSGLAIPAEPMPVLQAVGLGLIGFGLLGAIALGVARWDQLDHQVATGIGMVLGAVVALLALLVAVVGLSHRMTAHFDLLLTVDALVIGTERQPVRIPWHELRGVRRHWRLEERGAVRVDDRVRNLLSFDVAGGAGTGADDARDTPPTIPADRLTVDPELVVAIIEFYREHPEERSELNTVVWADRVISLAREQA